MSNYPYASGTIKSIENNLLDRNKLLKLQGLSKEAFIKALSDMDYGNGSNTLNLEALISSEMMEVKKLLLSLSPSAQNILLLFISNDALNIKVLYKAKCFGTNGLDVDKLLTSTGSMDINLLKDKILNSTNNQKSPYDFFVNELDHNSKSKLSKDEQTLLNQIDGAITNETNARIMSTKIDDQIYTFSLNKAHGTPCFVTYFKSLIDFTNVITFVRSTNLHWDYDRFLEMFIDGGTIDKKFFKDNYVIESKKDEDKIVKNYMSFYNEEISKILKDYFEKKNLNRLETKFDSLLIKIVSAYKNDVFTAGPLLYYYLEKTAEAKNIRMLYANQNAEQNDLLIF